MVLISMEKNPMALNHPRPSVQFFLWHCGRKEVNNVKYSDKNRLRLHKGSDYT